MKPENTEISDGRSLQEKILSFLFFLLQMTWGLPQTLLGFLLFLKYRKQPHRPFRLALHTVWDEVGYGISLGPFLFTDETAPAALIAHEYGHSVQSLLLGPFYLLLIGLPSFLWCRAGFVMRRRKKAGADYYSFYTEAWAEHIADRYREDAG